MDASQRIRFIVKPLLFLACCTPFVLLGLDAARGTLSANPIDDVTDTTGTWTLRFIMLTLAVTPIRKITGWNRILQFRRMLGLFAFFSGTLHLFTYLYLDQFFLWEEILADIPQRPFIMVGFLSFVLMLPLAATSTDRIAKWVGGKRWNRLHKLVYLTAIGGVVHYLWLVKADIQRPLIYGSILAVLLGVRAWYALKPVLARWSPRSVETPRESPET